MRTIYANNGNNNQANAFDWRHGISVNGNHLKEIKCELAEQRAYSAAFSRARARAYTHTGIQRLCDLFFGWHHHESTRKKRRF